MRQSDDLKPYAKLVSGEDNFGHFKLLDKPTGLLSEKDLKIADENVQIQEQFLFAGANLKGQ